MDYRPQKFKLRGFPEMKFSFFPFLVTLWRLLRRLYHVQSMLLRNFTFQFQERGYKELKRRDYLVVSHRHRNSPVKKFEFHPFDFSLQIQWELYVGTVDYSQC